ncbi:hypothetical protein AMECASPLE_032505 [Ameca splendens]|uniref:Uncharacterized protein n=1 Tax=Ameca splendens TaxID=208324 RepID=A0ABV1AD01_9TELE
MNRNEKQEVHGDKNPDHRGVLDQRRGRNSQQCGTFSPCGKDTVLQVDLLREIHLTGDGGENETFLPAIGQRELNLPVQTAGSEQGRVQSVSSVSGHDHLRERVRANT